MPYPPRKSTGRGKISALLLGIGLFAIVITFLSVCPGTEYITFPYDGGKTGTAFYYRSTNNRNHPTPIILFFHGYNNLKTYDFRLVEFTRRGWDVLSVDLPGHGTSPEEITTGCWKIVFGALDFIETRPELWNISAIGVVGHSFGGLVSAMGLLFDPRIAAGVLWAPALNLVATQGRADQLFPYGHPFARFTAEDSPLTYIQSGKTLNNTLILHGTDDATIPISVNLGVFDELKAHDPINATHFSFQEIPKGDHLLYYDSVVRDTITWFAPYLEPARATEIIDEVRTTPVVFLLFFALELLALFGLFPAIFVIFGDQLGKAIERRRWNKELSLGIQRDEYPLATPAISRKWKWHLTAYVIALGFIIYTGVNLLAYLSFQLQLGLMGLLLTGLVFLYNYFRILWTKRKRHISKTVEEAEDRADDLIDPWESRLKRYGKHLLFGIGFGAAFLTGLYIFTFIFGFFFVFPTSFPYAIGSIAVSFAFSLGLEWLFRYRIQVLINEAKPYNKVLTTKILNTMLIVVLPAVIGVGFFRFAAIITPAVYILFYSVAALCPVINWYLFDHTKSIVTTVTFSTFVMGWILGSCITPVFF